MDVVIYHNPKCGTSRNMLGLIRNAGIEPHIIDYLKSPPTRTLLKELIARAGLTRKQSCDALIAPMLREHFSTERRYGRRLPDAAVCHHGPHQIR